MGIFAITLYLVAYLCTLIDANAVDNPTGRIYQGEKVTSCETYPWHARVYYGDYFCGFEESNNLQCGGTLISDKFVLTAAHCSTYCKVGQNYIVYLGSTKRCGGIQYEGFLKACYNESDIYSYDVAIVELTESVAETNCIGYFPIFDVEAPDEDDLPVTAIGFGHTESTLYPYDLYETTSLRTVNISTCLTDDDVKQQNMTLISVNAHICTISNNDDLQKGCSGDSGGSLFYKEDGNEPVLIGVASLGQQYCNSEITRTIYAKVNDPIIFHWIKKMTEIM